MKRALLAALLLLGGCGKRDDFAVGREAILYRESLDSSSLVVQPPSNSIVDSVVVPVGTRVMILGDGPPNPRAPGHRFRISIREGEHAGFVGSVSDSNLRPVP